MFATLKSIFFITILFLWCITFKSTTAQNKIKINYNINLYNGLATNCIYNTLVDHHGYLWICTDNGVYRYNGYSLSKYNLATGLPNNDVWGLKEDSRHRLWIQTITNGLGYIYNNKCHSVYFPDKHKTFYPRMISENNGGIFLLNPEINTESLQLQRLYTERNDTLFFTGKNFREGVITGKNEVTTYSDKKISSYLYNEAGNLLRVNHVNNRLYPLSRTAIYLLFRNYLIAQKQDNNFFLKQNLQTNQVTKIAFTDDAGIKDTIRTIGLFSQKLYILTNHAFHTVDSNLNVTGSYPISQLVNGSDSLASRISMIDWDDFWGTFIATRTQGLIISQDNQQYFEKMPILNVADYKYVGKLADTLSYWWDQNDRVLFTIDEHYHWSKQQYKFLYDVVKIVPFNEKKSLLITKSDLYWLDNRTHYVSPAALTNINTAKHKIYSYNRDATLIDSNHIFLAGYNFSSGTLTGNTITHRVFTSGGRYYNLEFDSLYNAFWLYNNDRILFRPLQGQEMAIDRTLFQQYGIRNIEKLVRDRPSATLFLKDNTDLYKIDLNKRTIRKLFKNYNLENALFYINNGTIILAGKFGVLFSPVNAPEENAVILYPNVKNSLYSKIENAAVLQHKIILKTDKGLYSSNIPDAATFKNQHATPLPYKTIFQYRDTLYDIARQHRFHIVPDAKNIGIDIINPRGNGALSIQYFIAGIDSSWNLMNGNEITLPVLTPLKDYILYLKAGDDVWNSGVTFVTLHMVPRWWQTPGWQILLWLCGSVAAFGILLIVMLVTRNYVMKSGQKKQYRTMLELRAIYAQLNPHFIFNTLNTALYFIKKKQIENATSHVTTFSRLLRAYLESAMNKYVSVENEITNLGNYIQLEQKRFEDVFTYEIINDIPLYEAVYIPSLLLQPIVENAINHGLLPKGKAGHLKIMFSRNADKSIVCIVDDNGIGREKAIAMKQEQFSARPSHGSRLIQELTNAFNKYEKLGIEIAYTDKVSPLSGTLVTILIKTPHDHQSL